MIADSLHHAFDRIDDFLAVQAPLSPDDLAPVLRLQSAAGVDDAERAALKQRVAALGCADRGGAILLGVLLGLFAAQLADEG